MIFALGFLAAGLIVLLFFPTVWGRAMRLSRRRLERQIPLSMVEVVAERDRLRAECAVVQRRIEQKAEHLARDHAIHLGELGRRAVRIAVLEADAAARQNETAELERRWRDASRTLAETEAELGSVTKELYDLSGLFDRTRSALAGMTEENRKLGDLAERQRVAIASLEMALEGAHAKIEDLDGHIPAGDWKLPVAVDGRPAAPAETSPPKMPQAANADAAHARIVAVAKPVVAKAAVQGFRVATATQEASGREVIGGPDETATAGARTSADIGDDLNRSAPERQLEQEVLQRLAALRAEKAALDGALQAAREEREALLRDMRAARAAASERASSETGGADGGAAPPRPAEIKPRRERAAARDNARAALRQALRPDQST